MCLEKCVEFFMCAVQTKLVNLVLKNEPLTLDLAAILNDRIKIKKVSKWVLFLGNKHRDVIVERGNKVLWGSRNTRNAFVYLNET